MVIKSTGKYPCGFILAVLFLLSHGAGAVAIPPDQMGGEGTGTATIVVKKTFVVPEVSVTASGDLKDLVTTAAGTKVADVIIRPSAGPVSNPAPPRGQFCLKGETAASNRGANTGFFIGATSALDVIEETAGRKLAIADGYDTNNCVDAGGAAMALLLKTAKVLTAGTNTLTINAKQYLP